jgi:NAD+ synthase (glutamine-hydrolysing)
MGKLVILSTCSLNQWALDWTGNLQRIKQSIKLAKNAGARYHTTPELSIPGYGLLDHFLEQDTIRHSWEMLAQLLLDRELDDIIFDVGMPVRHAGRLYNARVVMLNGKVLLIRPKMSLAGGEFSVRGTRDITDTVHYRRKLPRRKILHSMEQTSTRGAI